MSKDTKWRIVLFALPTCILALCYVAVKLCNSGHEGWGLALVITMLFATFFDIYLMAKREDYIDSQKDLKECKEESKKEEVVYLPCVVANIGGANLPCIRINNQVHKDIMETLESIVKK